MEALSDFVDARPIQGLRDAQLYSVLLLLLVIVVGIHLADYVYTKRGKKSLKTSTPTLHGTDPYNDIESLPDFEWKTTEPLQIRPFKPKYHLTMALENCPLSELIAMDKTYLERIHLRRRLVEEQGENVLNVNPQAFEAAYEIYDWMMFTYLPQRYPTMFKVERSAEQGQYVRNLVTGELLPSKPASGTQAMELIGTNIDWDFLILHPEKNPPNPEQPRYVMHGYMTCFPAGFSTPDKLSKVLADIHTPVPGYAEKIGKSMDRFFHNLPTGKAVKRANWSVGTDWKLFKLSGNHLYANKGQNDSAVDVTETTTPDAEQLQAQEVKVREQLKKEQDAIIIDNCCMRVERQTLFRLPQTRALVFGFKTYQYALSQLKDEGNGPTMAAAIDGLSLGNVPAVAYYKRAVVWGDPVKKYLLS